VFEDPCDLVFESLPFLLFSSSTVAIDGFVWDVFLPLSPPFPFDFFLEMPSFIAGSFLGSPLKLVKDL